MADVLVKSYTRRKKADTPPDPLAASFPATRERIAKLREDIRNAQSEETFIRVMDFAPAPGTKPSIIDRFMPWFGRRG